MHLDTPINQQVLRILFPFRSGDADPPTIEEHARKHLIPEVRREVQMYFGDALANTLEARFPGLDYTRPDHRARLSRFPHHRRLFAAFDELGLTPNEIYRLCNWEGSLWIKRRYELSRGSIRDTAGDFIFGGREDRASRAAKRAAREAVRGEDGQEEDGTEIVEHEVDDEVEAEPIIDPVLAIDEDEAAEDDDDDDESALDFINPQQYDPAIGWRVRRGDPTVAVSSAGLRLQMSSNTARPEAARAAA